MFRVVYPMDSEYGLQIISDRTVGTVTLKGNSWEEGKNVYNNAIKILNNEAEKYVNPTYAYDGRCVGCIPTVKNGKYIDKNKEEKTTVVLPLSEWTSYTRPEGWTSDDTGCYESDENCITDQRALMAANIWTTGDYYVLASRLVTSYTYFCIRTVMVSGGRNGDGICMVTPEGGTRGGSLQRGLRPCILLKSNDIKITGGDGKSEATAYTLGI